MIHKRRFDIRECEGCLKIKACFLLDPPYQPLVKDIASKYNPDYCPCQICIIKGMCDQNCDHYSSILTEMYDYYQEKWELKEAIHKKKIDKLKREVFRLFP